DWSADVCSSDLHTTQHNTHTTHNTHNTHNTHTTHTTHNTHNTSQHTHHTQHTQHQTKLMICCLPLLSRYLSSFTQLLYASKYLTYVLPWVNLGAFIIRRS